MMLNKTLSIIALVVLVACSQSETAQTAASQTTSASSFPEAVLASAVAVPNASPVANNWTPPTPAADAKGQAQQLHDLMVQLQNEAAERMVAQRQKNMQPSHEESLSLMRAETEAVRQGIEKLKQLSLSDQEVQQVRDWQVNSLTLFADSADLQWQSAQWLAQGKQAEADKLNAPLNEKLNAIQTVQPKAEQALAALLQKYQIQP